PCAKVRSSALTRPIVVIVTALDDWTSRVMTAPQKAPESGVAAALPRAMRRADPASILRPSLMTSIPSRNSPTPPRMAIAVDMVELVGVMADRMPLYHRSQCPNGPLATEHCASADWPVSAVRLASQRVRSCDRQR